MRFTSVISATIACTFIAGASYGEEILPKLLIPGLGNGLTKVDLETTYEPGADLSDQPGEYESISLKGSVSAEFYRSTDYTIFGSLEVGHHDIDSDIILNDYGRLPEDIAKIQLTVGSEWQINDETVLVMKAGIDSTSNKPFNSFDEKELIAESYIRFNVGRSDGIIMGLRFGNRDFTLSEAPLPIIAYHYVPNRELSILAGLPILAVNWRPIDNPWSVDARIVAASYSLGVHYQATPNDRISFEARNTAWQALLSERKDRKQTLSYGDHQIGFTYNRQMGKAQLSIGSGASLGREISFEKSRSIFEDDDPNRQSIDIDPTPYIRVALNVSF